MKANIGIEIGSQHLKYFPSVVVVEELDAF